MCAESWHITTHCHHQQTITLMHSSVHDLTNCHPVSLLFPPLSPTVLFLSFHTRQLSPSLVNSPRSSSPTVPYLLFPSLQIPNCSPLQFIKQYKAEDSACRTDRLGHSAVRWRRPVRSWCEPVLHRSVNTRWSQPVARQRPPGGRVGSHW